MFTVNQLSQRFRNLAAGICSHSFARSSVRPNTEKTCSYAEKHSMFSVKKKYARLDFSLFLFFFVAFYITTTRSSPDKLPHLLPTESLLLLPDLTSCRVGKRLSCLISPPSAATPLRSHVGTRISPGMEPLRCSSCSPPFHRKGGGEEA